MKLLVVTQALDLNDPLLSAYHGWVAALAREAGSVEAICLKEGRHALPGNVRVHSLGKERGARSRLAYAASFLRLAWRLRDRYDAAFVHMNQEYLLVAGPLWKLLGKPAYLWRNHYAGSWRTDLAAAFCAAVFCTSRSSYTAKYRKTEIMPVGVDLERFAAVPAVPRTPATAGRSSRTVLFFSRLTPSKRPELFVDALALLKGRGVPFTATICGSPNEGDDAFADSVHARVERAGLADAVSFRPGIPNDQAPALYAAHELFVNCSPSGMLDKTVFEAAASGCLVLTESDDLRAFGFEDATYAAGNAESLAAGIERMLALPDPEKGALLGRLADLARTHDLRSLAAALVRRMEMPSEPV